MAPSSLERVQRQTQSPPGRRARTLACTLALCGVAASAGAAPSSASAAVTNLGPPNYAGYCQSIGSVRAAFTAEHVKQWGCQAANGAVTVMNVQAACEFSYPQRPIAAEELQPGELFTFQCLQKAGGGPLGAAQEVQLQASLQSVLAPRGGAGKLGLVLKSGYSYRVRAPHAGRVVITWFFLPKGARISSSKPQPVIVAGGSASFTRPGTKTVRMVLTARGRQMLKHARHLRLTARATFTPSLGRAVIALKTFTISR